MTMSDRIHRYLLLAVLLLAAGPVMPLFAQDLPGGRVIIPADATSTHRLSGMAFPPHVGDFRRAGIHRLEGNEQERLVLCTVTVMHD